MKKIKKKLTVVDLFCGGGLGAMGVKQCGFDIIYAIDNNKHAADTYNNNVKDCCVLADIRNVDIDEIPNSDIILGSPVCKPFSFAGNNKGFEDDKYGDLVSHYIKIIKSKRPKAFVFENVKGMISNKHKPQFEAFLDDLRVEGYNIQYRVLNAYNYGIAQLRERLIVVGVRNDINKKFNYPIEEKNKVNIIDTLGNLPKPSLIMNSAKDIQYKGNVVVKNHIGYGIRKDELPFVDSIPSGGNWRNLSEDDAKKFLGKAYYSEGGRTGFLRKVDINKAAHTITSTMNGKNNSQIIDNRDLYGDNCKDMPSSRRFTVRECLRLQSVPDTYVIDDRISLIKQYEIVGNGIPSRLLYKIFKELEITLT